MMKKVSKANIPDGWDEATVGRVFSFLKSYAISRENLINGTLNNEGIRNIHYGDLHSTYGKPSINLRECSVPLVKDKNFSPKEDDFLVDGDLIMADVSEDYSGVGVTVSVHGIGGKKVVGGLHTFVLRDIHKKTIEKYRQYIFRNPHIRNQLQKIANGVSVYGISKTSLSKLVLILPPLPEQKRIVAVLETWDSYIAKLERKIEIKKNIKKSLMQQLLSGNRRLPNHNKKWSVKKIKEFAECIAGGTPLTSKEEYWGGHIRWMNSGELNFKTVTEVKGRITELGLNNSSTKELPIGCVLIGLAGQGKTRGTIAINMLKLCTNQSIAAILPNEDFHAKYLYYNLDNRYDELRSLSTGEGGRGGLNLAIIKNIAVPFPVFAEQEAIANVLTKADEDVKFLEQKKRIIEAQKKFLLNNLVTGKIRTPESMKV